MNIIKIPKIAYIMTPITFGGAERVNLNFLENVDKEKFNIEPILFLRPWDAETIFETELKRIGLNYFVVPVAKSLKKDFFQLFRRFQLLNKIIRSNSYDLIHSHGYLADILCFMVSIFIKVPIMSTCHGFIYEGSKLSLYNKLDIHVLNHFARIIAVSEPLKSDLIKSGINEDKVTVVNNTPSRPDINNVFETRCKLRHNIAASINEIIIGFIGRLSNEKGIVYLLEALKLLIDDAQPARLLIIGEGPQLKELEDMVNSSNLSTKVIFTGFKSNIDEWFAAIDLFVLPSLTEGTPMVLLEAMSHGVPCIASAVGGIPNIIEPGVDGILVSPGKPEEIRNAIHCLISDPTKRRLISSNAKDKISKEYSINEWVRKIEKEYLNLYKA